LTTRERHWPGPVRGASGGQILHQTYPVFSERCFKVYLPDSWRHFGFWSSRALQGKGPRPKPRWMPLPELLYALYACVRAHALASVPGVQGSGCQYQRPSRATRCLAPGRRSRATASHTGDRWPVERCRYNAAIIDDVAQAPPLRYTTAPGTASPAAGDRVQRPAGARLPEDCWRGAGT